VDPNLERERSNIDFEANKGIRYHAYRRSFFDGIDNFFKISTIVTGTSVFVTIVGEHTFAAQVLALLVAVLSAADVVFRFSIRSRDHDALYHDYSRLAQEIAKNTRPTEADIALWKARRLEIEMNEPGIIELLERRCAAEEATAQGRPLRDQWRLSRWQILFSQWAIWPALPQNLAS